MEMCEAAWCTGKEHWIWNPETVFLIPPLYDLGKVIVFGTLGFSSQN